MDWVETANKAAIWIAIALLLGILLMILYYPSGQAYLRCEKNAPLIQQYEECVATKDSYPSFTCVNRTWYTPTNWTLVTP